MENQMDFNKELEAFRRLTPRVRIEQLILKLETDEVFQQQFKQAFDKWEIEYDGGTHV